MAAAEAETMRRGMCRIHYDRMRKHGTTAPPSVAPIAERLATVAQVDGALVDLYEKVRRNNNGTGAAALREGRCDGCHLAINSVELSRMKTLASDEVVRCEECRCILVRGTK